MRRIRFAINGVKKVAEVEPRLLLAHLIRRGLGLTGTHMGCDTTNCGACTVLVDGKAIKSCTMLAVQVDGREVTTVEGLATASELHPLQEGFKEEHGLQCGFCTPGMMLAAKALLDANPDPTEEDVRWALSGNLCRCTGYQNIVKSVLWAAAKLRGEPASSRLASQQRRRDVTALDEIKIGGLGASRKRVEDNRFIRGKGNYTDDIVLPGMLHMEILRSPLAHARIVSIDTSRAWQIPGVHLVLTGEMMATRNLAWMPTLSYDTQAVLATDKVRFQGQEVACVIADDPYIAKDACEAIDVEYEPLPADRQPGAGARRRRAGHPRRQGGPGQQRHLQLGGRRRGGDRAGVRPGGQDLPAAAALPAVAPLADRVLRVDRGLQPGHLQAHRVHDDPGPAHHPGRGGAGGRAARAHDPDHLARHRRRLRQQGAGLPRVRLLDPGLHPAGVPGQVDRGQDRQPDLHRVRAGHLPRRRAGAAQRRQDPRRPHARRLRPRRVLLRRPAEQVQDRAAALRLRLLQHPGRPHHRPRDLHQQGPRRGRLPVLVPGHRGDVLPGADDAGRGLRPRHGPGRVPADQPGQGRPVPVPDPVRLPDRLGPVRQVPGRRAEGGRLRGLPPAAGGGARPGAGCWAWASPP